MPQTELARDLLRPQFHLLPPANWINDPNAPIYWKGSYHMFYQYNPNGAYWGDMHWGHAISADMIHWKHLPMALSPTAGGPDTDGCFTGSSVIQNGRVIVLYTGVVAVPLDRATRPAESSGNAVFGHFERPRVEGVDKAGYAGHR